MHETAKIRTLNVNITRQSLHKFNSFIHRFITTCRGGVEQAHSPGKDYL